MLEKTSAKIFADFRAGQNVIGFAGGNTRFSAISGRSAWPQTILFGQADHHITPQQLRRRINRSENGRVSMAKTCSCRAVRVYGMDRGCPYSAQAQDLR
jgi:hypothetical protein